MSFLKNQYVQGVFVFFLIVGAYAAYVNLQYDTEEMGMEHMSDQDEEVTMPHEGMDMDDMDMESSEMMDDGELDLSGTHIMANGAVMTGAGVVIADAVIREDGMIELSDGTEIEPAFDMRP